MRLRGPRGVLLDPVLPAFLDMVGVIDKGGGSLRMDGEKEYQMHQKNQQI